MLKGDASDDLAQASKALSGISAALQGSQDKPLTAALANFANRLSAAAKAGTTKNGTAVARRAEQGGQFPGPGGFHFGGSQGGPFGGSQGSGSFGGQQQGGGQLQGGFSGQQGGYGGQGQQIGQQGM